MASIKVVYGAPCSGKSTYVRENIKDNDVRFDYDLIMQAISNKGSYEYSDIHLPYVIECRGMIIGKASTDKEVEAAYILTCKITDKLKQELGDLDVEYILMDKTKEECYELLEQDETREDKEFWKQKINEWFDWYEGYSNKKEVRQIKDKVLQLKAKDKKTGKLKNTGKMEIKNATSGRAELYFYGDIVSSEWDKWEDTDTCPTDIRDFLKEIEDVKNLDIYVNSGGGSVFAGMAIYNMLKRFKGCKTTHIDGLAGSISSVIALAADRVIIPSNAYFMIHKPWTWTYGNANDLRKLADDMDKIEQGILNVYKDHLRDGVDFEKIKKMVNDETWLTGDEAAEYFDVEVEEKIEAVACTSDYFMYCNKVPEQLSKPINNKGEQEQNENEKEKLLMELDLI